MKQAMKTKPQSRYVIAERFVALRTRVGLSQSCLGKLIGLCRQAVSEIENRRVMPHNSTWERFCEYESEGQNCGVGHLPKDHWQRCQIELELSTKGDTLCASG
jgi:DNA-binding XRE family transcriptional regulator